MLNPNPVCIAKGNVQKLKEFNDQTTLHGYPDDYRHYDGSKVRDGQLQADNRLSVSFKKYFLLKYHAHINTSVKSIHTHTHLCLRLQDV